ncbi:uncharacterized protein fam217bb isoform X2 [Hypomesus transpacificus]|uniref:uncharacterized protein fam217bb isoform X2 n=1 Tax=Hypomesus transpacificus TaxID=137520 RepID=UPI001F080E14|nr:uncharacterized protein fam217bb isoform X2 [Hypomesus transpacificus]
MSASVAIKIFHARCVRSPTYLAVGSLTTPRCKLRERLDKISWDADTVTSTNMGRRSKNDKTHKSLQPVKASQDNSQPVEKQSLQRRRRHKINSLSTKHNTSQLKTQHQPDAKPHSLPSTGDGNEHKDQRGPHYSRHREQKHTGPRKSRCAPTPLLSSPSEPSSDPQKDQAPNPETVKLSEYREKSKDSDSDVSESERLPVLPSHCTPPQLNLRAEVIDSNDFSPHTTGRRRQGHDSLSFPDFLPPPFNAWSLGQLAVYYNMERGVPPRPRPVEPLERYMERLLQLEWHQFQTVQEEGGKSNDSIVAGCHHRPHVALSSRLSCPKSILQCQRAFPFTFLSSLASHTVQLSGCSCTACRTLHTTCCRSHVQHRHSQLSPPQEPRGRAYLPPKRSYSESRAHSPDKSMTRRAQRFGSPERGKSYMKNMQAFGNIRNPVSIPPTGKPQSVVKGLSVGTENKLGCIGVDDKLPRDHRQVGLRRSGSEQRSGSERKNGSECLRSERKRSGSERRRAGLSEARQPDVIGAIVDHLLGSKNLTIVKPNGRLKQVEFTK